jgi:hypothetical protein
MSAMTTAFEFESTTGELITKSTALIFPNFIAGISCDKTLLKLKASSAMRKLFLSMVQGIAVKIKKCCISLLFFSMLKKEFFMRKPNLLSSV